MLAGNGRMSGARSSGGEALVEGSAVKLAREDWKVFVWAAGIVKVVIAVLFVLHH